MAFVDPTFLQEPPECAQAAERARQTGLGGPLRHGSPAGQGEVAARPSFVSGPSLSARLAYHRGQVVALEAEQRQQLLTTIAASVGGVAFTAAELFEHAAVCRELRDALVEAGITNARQLAKRLQRLRGRGLVCVCRVRAGRLWAVC